MALTVFNEIGRLHRVLIHRPGPEIDLMVPEMMEFLLFDDILDGERARAEHDAFRSVLAGAGVETLEAQELLAEVLEEDEVRRALTDRVARRYGLARDVVARLEAAAPATLAATLIAGVRTGSLVDERQRHFFDLAPVPNYFFQRDPQFVLGDRVVISSMATEAREREPALARLLFQHHPALAGAGVVALSRPPFGGPDHDPETIDSTVEGGDVLVASPEVLLVGLSERTNRRGVEALGEELRSRRTTFRSLIVVEVPAKRSFMHLDTVFTFIDRDLCLAHLPVVEPDRQQSAHAYLVDLDSEALTFRLCSSLLAALAEVGIEPEIVPCGGEDRIHQEREQWTDGANAFAIEPGVIVLYQRNRRTLEALARRGWRVIAAEDALGGEPVCGRGPTVVTFTGNELSRARGGPRCMTMPLERDAL